MRARAAFPNRPSRKTADPWATALWTIRFAPIVSPADTLESGPRLLLRHASDGAKRERFRGCGKEEMLGQDDCTKYDVLCIIFSAILACCQSEKHHI
jgi:hypothetical protein